MLGLGIARHWIGSSVPRKRREMLVCILQRTILTGLSIPVNIAGLPATVAKPYGPAVPTVVERGKMAAQASFLARRPRS